MTVAAGTERLAFILADSTRVGCTKTPDVARPRPVWSVRGAGPRSALAGHDTAVPVATWSALDLLILARVQGAMSSQARLGWPCRTISSARPVSGRTGR